MPEVELVMPKADPNMSEGRIIEWMKQPGDRIEIGDVLANVETEKLEFPVESTVAGVLRRTLANAGETVGVGKPIAVIETST